MPTDVLVQWRGAGDLHGACQLGGWEAGGVHIHSTESDQKQWTRYTQGNSMMLGGKHGDKIPNSIIYLIADSWMSTYTFTLDGQTVTKLPACSDWSGGWGSEEMKERVRSERVLAQAPVMTYQNGTSRIHSLACAWVKNNKMKGNRIWKFRDQHSTLALPLLLSSFLFLYSAVKEVHSLWNHPQSKILTFIKLLSLVQ